MWGAALIVFREVFEIAIILCVILAATRAIPKRLYWINLGIALGTIGAFIFALITHFLIKFFGGHSQLYVNAGILFLAVIMISWTVIWMKIHGRQITQTMRTVSRDITLGDKPLYILAVIVGLAVLREGSEIVIFIFGLIAAQEATLRSALLGSVIGIISGILVGRLMYLGLLRISIKYLFQIPSILLTLIAGGMAANAAGKLVKVGFLPGLINPLWDTSNYLSQHSIAGKFLFILIGYQDRPSAMQILFYFLTVLTVYLFAQQLAKKK